jgi:hypothetical protein
MVNKFGAVMTRVESAPQLGQASASLDSDIGRIT